MSQIQKIDDSAIEMVEIHWTTQDGKEHKTYFEERVANIFVQKHLLPKEKENIISNVGTRKIY